MIKKCFSFFGCQKTVFFGNGTRWKYTDLNSKKKRLYRWLGPYLFIFLKKWLICGWKLVFYRKTTKNNIVENAVYSTGLEKIWEHFFLKEKSTFCTVIYRFSSNFWVRTFFGLFFVVTVEYFVSLNFFYFLESDFLCFFASFRSCKKF